MNHWWIENGKKVRGEDTFTEMPCHEQTDLSKIGNAMLSKLDQLDNLMFPKS